MAKIPSKKIKQYYKRFADGDQYIEISPITGEILEQERQYYWQSRIVYNLVKPMILEFGKDLTDDQLYGKDGLVALLEPWQRTHNDIMTKHNQHLDNATSGYLVVEDGSVDVDELEEDGLAPGKIVVYRQGANWPHREKDTLKPEVYIESATYCYNMMRHIADTFSTAVFQKAIAIEAEKEKFIATGYACAKE
jgi:hypothetical protein